MASEADNSVSPRTDAELLRYNQTSLEELRNVLQYGAGEFSLTLAACNYHRLRNLVVQTLINEGLTQVLRLPREFLNLREILYQDIQGEVPRSLLVIGLDYLPIPALIEVLQGANLARDEFRKRFSFPLVLWMNRRVQQSFARYAPDFRSFSPSAIAFTLPPEELIYSLKAGAAQVFYNVLERWGDRQITTTSIQLQGSDALRSELEFAVQDLAVHGITPAPGLQASLDFLQGREAHSRFEMDTALQLYQSSLAYWKSQLGEEPVALLSETALAIADQQAALWLHLGWWWRNYAVLQRVTYLSSLRQARAYFEQLIQYFRDTEQMERLARFIHVLAEVLQKQQDWAGLEALAIEGVSLHLQTSDPVRLARDHGFLAEVALVAEDWPTAKSEAEQAIALLESAQDSLADTPEDIDLANALEIAKSFQRGWYRFLLGSAQIHLTAAEVALPYLEAARWETDPEVDLTLHLKVLNELIRHYFEQGYYWEAFDVKQERRQVEYRYNQRAFIGAGAVQPHQRTTVSQPFDGVTPAAVAAEIRASGRLQDVEVLAARLQDPRYPIIVVHGPSGVGKSSIISAGLLPKIRTLYPQGRTTVPILVQTYSTWQQGILTAVEQRLNPIPATDTDSARALKVTANPAALVNVALPTATALFERFQVGLEKNTFFVLIFDQFEEFFFEQTSLASRQVFYRFLQQCLDEPWIKVVLSLREDYLHYLLEAERFINLSSALGDWDLLSREVRYPLANFTSTAAEEVIRQLTVAAQYFLDEGLIQRLVADLAAETGDVRPIELQVVGAQLQREDITTLAQYEALGDYPKETLVQDYLSYVVRDCGPPNERLAWVVLFLLTDEDREQRLYRPLKTREDIEYELSLLEMPHNSEQLSMVLSILVGSGLVFEIPQEPENRYQLVHDYLVRYVRDVQTPALMMELTTARDRERQLFLARQASTEKTASSLTTKNQDLILQNQVLVQKSSQLEQHVLWQRALVVGIGLLTLWVMLT